VLSDPAARSLRLFEDLHEPVNFAVGIDPEFVAAHAPNADVIVVGSSQADLLQLAFPLAQRVRWVHSLATGVEKILFPALVESPVPLTNGRGVFSRALAEFAIAAILFFAKDLRRLVRSQQAGKWDQFDIELVRGQVMGVVGFGDIGRETARLARALGMRIVAIRSRPSANVEPEAERVLSPAQLREMLRMSDYVVLSTPLTPETRGMIGEGELKAMKETAVIVNIGRGPLVAEPALVAALSANRIRGAALDVFDEEPLPVGHPFYSLENVLLSPHSADHTRDWADAAMKVFLANFELFRTGQPLLNIVDKRAGY